MVTVFNLVVFLMAMALMGIVLLRNKRVDSTLIMAVILICCNCFGRYLLSAAHNLETAIVANGFIYVGACYIPLLMVQFLTGLCDFKMPKLCRSGLLIYSTIVFGCALTVGHSTLYYRHVELVKANGYSFLVKEYGPAHSLFVAMMILYGGIMALYIIYTLKNWKKMPVQATITISGLGFAVFSMYILEQVLKPTVSFLTLGYLAGIIFLIGYYKRLKLYDMSSNIAIAIEEHNQHAYLVLDEKHCFVDANTLMKELYPEIETWRVDREVPEADTDLYREVIVPLKKQEIKNESGKYVSVADKYYEIEIRKIPCGKQNRFGYLIEFSDRTLEKKYYNAVEEYNTKLQEAVEERTAELKQQEMKTRNLFLQTVAALSEAVDAKDRYTSGHSRRVAEYARMIAERMGKSKEEQEEIFQAGLLHDVGKIRVPAEIINKPGRLTDEEFALIKIHPVTGYRILHEVSEETLIAISAKYHHERYDGKGYPNGLVGEQIPEIARILGVADSYDAMTSNRSYRDALPQDVVSAEIEKGKGTQFDPQIADIMLQMMQEDTEYRMRQREGMKKRILSVDDEPMNNKIVARIMKDEPMYEIVAASDGAQALELLEEQDFDLILLDMMMPEMDGLETMKRIRQKSQIPVVIMTADKTLDTSVEFAKLGCDDYLTKPLQPLLLKEVVHNMTENERTLYSELKGRSV